MIAGTRYNDVACNTAHCTCILIRMYNIILVLIY